MKSCSNIKRDFENMREKAVIAKHSIDELIASIDNVINATNIDNMIAFYYNNGCNYQDIAERVGLSYTAIRNHCKKLRDSGLIS